MTAAATPATPANAEATNDDASSIVVAPRLVSEGAEGATAVGVALTRVEILLVARIAAAEERPAPILCAALELSSILPSRRRDLVLRPCSVCE